MRNFKDGSKKPIPVELCLLREEDVPDMKKLLNNWQTTRYGYGILQDFIDVVTRPLSYPKTDYGVSFFMLKPANIEDLGSLAPICLAKTKRLQNTKTGTHYLELDRIQSAGKYLKRKENRQISGSGEMMMYTLARLATKLKSDAFFWRSSNNAFYEKILKFHPNGFDDNYFVLDEHLIKNFLEQIREKYGIKHLDMLPKDLETKIRENSYTMEW